MGRKSHKRLRYQQQNNGERQLINFSQNAEQFSQIEGRLMATITALCTEETPFENLDNLLQQLNVLRLRNSQEEQHRIAASLWAAYEELVGIMPSRTSLDLDAFFPAFTLSINTKTTEPSLTENALLACAYLAECVGFSFSAICPRLCQMIVNVEMQNIPDGDGIRWRALKRINESLSVSSLLHEYFPQFATILIGCLRTGKIELIRNNRDLFELVASILRTSTSMIKSIGQLADLQRHVCLAALSQNQDICLLKLLNSLLENNHEAIPLPIQAASTIFSRDYTQYGIEYREEVMKGRNLCQLVMRPRRVPCCGDLKSIAHSTFNNNSIIGEAATSASNISDVDLRNLYGEGGMEAEQQNYGNKPTSSGAIQKAPSNQNTIQIQQKMTALQSSNEHIQSTLRQVFGSEETQNGHDASDSDDSIIALEDGEEEIRTAKSNSIAKTTKSNSTTDANKKEESGSQKKKSNEQQNEEAATAGNDFVEMTTEEIFRDFVVD